MRVWLFNDKIPDTQKKCAKSQQDVQRYRGGEGLLREFQSINWQITVTVDHYSRQSTPEECFERNASDSHMKSTPHWSCISLSGVKCSIFSFWSVHTTKEIWWHHVVFFMKCGQNHSVQPEHVDYLHYIHHRWRFCLILTDFVFCIFFNIQCRLWYCTVLYCVCYCLQQRQWWKSGECQSR